MRSIIVDKIASVAIDADIGKEVRIENEIPAEEGVLIAVEILNNKARYNTLELTSGRMAALKRGDIIIGALGHRKALFGYSGHLPESVAEAHHPATLEPSHDGVHPVANSGLSFAKGGQPLIERGRGVIDSLP